MSADSERRPVGIPLAARHHRQHAIVYQARKGHRDEQRVGYRESKADHTQGHLEACRLVMFVGDEAAIRLGDRRGKQRARQDLQKTMCVDTRLPRQGKCLSQTIDDRRDQEITAKMRLAAGGFSSTAKVFCRMASNRV